MILCARAPRAAINIRGRKQMPGYGDPPRESQFPKGKSGNSRGRPKGRRNFATELRLELQEKVVSDGLKISKQRAIVKTIVSAALDGNLQAAMALLSLSIRVFGIDSADEAHPPLKSEDEELLRAHIEREVQRRLKSIESRPISNKLEDASDERD
jgi:uncharacterized protein DUF5681